MQDALHTLGLRAQRYSIFLPKTPIINRQYPKAYLNIMMHWPSFYDACMTPQGLNKVILHSTSAKISDTPEYYGNLSIAMAILRQTPVVVKSRKSVSAFKIMAGSLVGAKTVLRKKAIVHTFCYKWAFLSPSEDLHGAYPSHSISTNFFVFELGMLDYKTFEPLPGLYIIFDHSQS